MLLCSTVFNFLLPQRDDVGIAPTTFNKTNNARISYVKYSTGANRTARMAYRAFGKPDPTAARRAFLAERIIGEWHAESICLFCAKRYFASLASLFCILFSDKPEKSMPAERRMRRCKLQRASGAYESGGETAPFPARQKRMGRRRHLRLRHRKDIPQGMKNARPDWPSGQIFSLGFACVCKCCFRIRLIYWETERSSASAAALTCSNRSESIVMLIFSFNGFNIQHLGRNYSIFSP